jgi:TetR/AcrR family transcriptional regulator
MPVVGATATTKVAGAGKAKGNRKKIGKISDAPEKQTRNAELTRSRILEISRLEFSEKGYDGARIESIVKRCEVSKNLIYHYFEGKEALFVAVMELAYRRMRERQNDWSFAHLSPEEGIERLVTYTFDHFVEEPTVIRLINTENLHNARHISQISDIRKLYNPLLEAIKNLLERGQNEGIFRKGVDPVDCYITISGLSYFYLSNNATLSYLFDQDLMAPDRLAQRKLHIIDVVLGYLRP